MIYSLKDEYYKREYSHPREKWPARGHKIKVFLQVNGFKEHGAPQQDSWDDFGMIKDDVIVRVYPINGEAAVGDMCGTNELEFCTWMAKEYNLLDIYNL